MKCCNFCDAAMGLSDYISDHIEVRFNAFVLVQNVLVCYTPDDPWCSLPPVFSRHFASSNGPGRLDGKHCEWRGITCFDPCVVRYLECETCGGRLPERINLSGLRKASSSASFCIAFEVRSKILKNLKRHESEKNHFPKATSFNLIKLNQRKVTR
jgi:hypothetical protein